MAPSSTNQRHLQQHRHGRRGTDGNHNEIGRSVTEAAQGVNDIAKNISGVATSAKTPRREQTTPSPHL